jgi:hypothetical protein
LRRFFLLWLGDLISIADDRVLLIDLPIYIYLLLQYPALTSLAQA